MPLAEPEILFLTEDIRFSLRNQSHLRDWLTHVAHAHKQKINVLYYHFVSDEYLLQLNKKFLRHNTYTDIITWDFSETKQRGKKTINGEIFISIDRVNDNAKKFGVTRTNELHRVMAHGLLHLCGFGDKTLPQQKRMRAEEENALALRTF